MNRALIVLITAAALSTPALPAYASDGTYVTTTDGLTPRTSGVTVQAEQDGESMSVVDKSVTPLVVEGYQHEPYLRIEKDGVWENESSPATYLNKEATIGSLPTTAAADRPAQWKKISDQPKATWHDHRIHWMGSAQPPVVAADPGKPHLISRWTVPVTIDGRPAKITGRLDYEPGSDVTTYLLWTTVGIVVVALVAIQLLTRRRLEAARADQRTSDPDDGSELYARSDARPSEK